MAAPDPEVLGQLDELVRCAESVAWLAEHREITPVHVSKVKHDRQIRKVLDSIVSIYTRLMWSSFYSDASCVEGARVHRDHIVPVRVLVDRLIMNPREANEILGAVVLADITAEEHKRLGGIWKDHEDIYAVMLTCPPDDLFDLGMKRYARSGVYLHEVIF